MDVCAQLGIVYVLRGITHRVCVRNTATVRNDTSAYVGKTIVVVVAAAGHIVTWVSTSSVTVDPSAHHSQVRRQQINSVLTTSNEVLYEKQCRDPIVE